MRIAYLLELFRYMMRIVDVDFVSMFMQGVSMGDNFYYTNLLWSDDQFLDGTWDNSQHVSPIGTQSSPLVESSVLVRTNTKRTVSYKECEDNLLVSSLLKIQVWMW